MRTLRRGWAAFLLAMTASVAGLFCTPAGAADLLDAVRQAGALKVGLEGTYPPFNFRGG